MSTMKLVVASTLVFAASAATHASAQTTPNGDKTGKAMTAKTPKSGAMMKAAPSSGTPTAATDKGTATGGNPGGPTNRN